jgi:hypothetical protein
MVLSILGKVIELESIYMKVQYAAWVRHELSFTLWHVTNIILPQNIKSNNNAVIVYCVTL